MVTGLSTLTWFEISVTAQSIKNGTGSDRSGSTTTPDGNSMHSLSTGRIWNQHLSLKIVKELQDKDNEVLAPETRHALELRD